MDVFTVGMIAFWAGVLLGAVIGYNSELTDRRKK